jgi:hypothetical protein
MNLNNCGSQGEMIPKLPAIENLIVEKEHKDYSTNLHDLSIPINIDQNDPSAILLKEEIHDLHGLDITTIVDNFDALTKHLLREFEMEEEGAYIK